MPSVNQDNTSEIFIRYGVERPLFLADYISVNLNSIIIGDVSIRIELVILNSVVYEPVSHAIIIHFQTQLTSVIKVYVQVEFFTPLCLIFNLEMNVHSMFSFSLVVKNFLGYENNTFV
jgi:hypothetical protein